MGNNQEAALVRNLRVLADETVPHETMEYEVIADARIVGELTYGPYRFMIWGFGGTGQGEDQSLCLRVRGPAVPPSDRPWEDPQIAGFYNGASAARELVALASLFLRRRLRYHGLVRWGDRPTRSLGPVRWIDQALVSGESNLADLQPWLHLVERLRPALQRSFLGAAEFYQEALELIEEKPDLAYLNLVSAVEILSNQLPIAPPTVADYDPELAARLQVVADEEVRFAIEARLLEILHPQKIKLRFVDFILGHVEPSFWEGERPERGRIEPAQLAELLRRIYDQRSATLHRGQGFPISVFVPPRDGEEIEWALEISSWERSWKPKDFVPYPHFFERLVRHVLTDYLKRNQIP